MNDNKSVPPQNPREAAAYWFARVHSGAFSADEKREWLRWRRADARHEREFRALDEIWQATGMIPENELRELLEVPEARGGARPHLSRRQWLAGGAAACAAALAAGIGLPQVLRNEPSFAAEYATAAGEQRPETLPDGSTLELNTRTRVAVRYYDGQRRVELLEGEAMFAVAHDSRRPFLVDAGMTTVRVTGTQFNVRRDAGRVDVAVQSGSVEVTTGRWWNRHAAALSAGQRVQIRPDGMSDVEAADVAALTAWREGKVIFKDQPLEQVVQEMSRYLAHPIRLADSRLKGLRMTGVFNVQDAEAFLQALRNTLPVAVRMRADGGADLALIR